MTDQVHGYGQLAESVTGNWDIMSIYTTHPVGVTGVVQTLAQFKAAHGIATGTNISTLAAAKRTFEGTAIADDAGYNDAYATQKNLDSLVETVSQFAAPVMLGAPVSIASLTNPTTMSLLDFAGNAIVSAADFGTDLVEGNAVVYGVAFAVEHTDAYGASNVTLETAMDGMPVWATTASIAIDTDVSGSAPSAGGAVTSGAVSAQSTLTATKQSVVVVRSTNMTVVGGLASA